MKEDRAYRRRGGKGSPSMSIELQCPYCFAVTRTKKEDEVITCRQCGERYYRNGAVI